MITKEQVKNLTPNDDNFEETMLMYMAQNNPKMFNLTKAAEEASEFADVLLKTVNKKPEKAPDVQDVIDEFGDVFYRGIVALMTLTGKSFEEVGDLVAARCDKKISRLHEFVKEDLYGGGL